MTLNPLLLALPLLLVVGCDAVTDEPPAAEVNPGIVYLDVRGDARIEINGTKVADADAFAGEVTTEPPVVQAGVPFDVTVGPHTGDPACWTPAPSRVSVEGNTATVAVFDSVFVGRVCNLIGTNIPRTEQVTLDERGDAVVTVVGVQETSGTLEPFTLRFDIRVE